MSIKKLENVFNHFTNGNLTEATKAMQAFVLETAAEMNQRLADQEEVVEYMERDQGADLTHDISDDLEEIQSEEMYDDNDMSDMNCDELSEEGEEDMSHGDAEDDLVMDLSDDHSEEGDVDADMDSAIDGDSHESGEIEDVVTKIDAAKEKITAEVDAEFEALKAEFEAIDAGHDDMDAEDDGVDAEDHDDMDMGDDSEDAVATHADAEDEDGIEESIELTKVKVDNKDKTAKAMSAVGKPKKMLTLGGSPVVTSSKDSAKSTEGTKVKKMDGGNTVKDANKALIKESAENTINTKSLKDQIVKNSKRTK